MAKFENEELGAILTLPDTVKVPAKLKYDSAALLDGWNKGMSTYERLWAGVKEIATSLECEVCTLETNLEDADLKAAPVIEWAGLVTWSYVTRLEELEKN